MGAAVRGEDDRTEPGADDAADHGVLAGGRSEAAALPTAPVSAALYAGGHRLAGGCGRGTRNPERAGDEEAAPEGLLQLPRNAIPELGADLGGAVVPTAGEPCVSRAAHQVSGDAADTGVHRRAEKAGAAWAPWILAH